MTVSGHITTKSNLHIGGNDPGIDIGGIDSPVIRDPVTAVPYLPGSSLKGKLRSIMEYKHGKVADGGRPCGCGEEGCPVCVLFGPHFNQNHQLGPSRLLFRDAYMTQESVSRLESLGAQAGPYTALKTENIIDRTRGIAAQRGLRNQEVVPAGAQFQLNISVRIFEGDDQDQFAAWLEEALDILPREAIGGSGSRGYGWVEVQYTIE
jgi:CRISPR-associated protein Csm3